MPGWRRPMPPTLTRDWPVLIACHCVLAFGVLVYGLVSLYPNLRNNCYISSLAALLARNFIPEVLNSHSFTLSRPLAQPISARPPKCSSTSSTSSPFSLQSPWSRQTTATLPRIRAMARSKAPAPSSAVSVVPLFRNWAGHNLTGSKLNRLSCSMVNACLTRAATRSVTALRCVHEPSYGTTPAYKNERLISWAIYRREWLIRGSPTKGFTVEEGLKTYCLRLTFYLT